MQKVFNYKNGLRLIVDTVPGLKSVSGGIWVDVGSAKETPDINGLSHFTEHMIFKGTDKLSPFAIADKFESLGAHINAFTGKGATCYFVKSIDEHFEECFKTLSHIFFDSIFDAGELDKERNVILEEINMVEDSPEDICFDLSASATYGTTALGQTILGPSDNIKRFKSEDVKKFIGDFYCASNIVVSLSGHITPEQADALVQKYVLNKACANQSFALEPKKMVIQRTHKQRIKDFEQSNIVLTYDSLPFNHTDFAIQNVLNVIAGGGMSSRLFQTIREKMGLAYSVYTTPSAHLYNGNFNIVLNISPENTQKTLDAVASELKKLKSGDVTGQEIERAKAQLKSALIFSRENVQSIMIATGKLLLMANEVFDIDKRIAQIDAVTADDVNAFAAKVFVDNTFCSAYVGKAHKADFNAFSVE